MLRESRGNIPFKKIANTFSWPVWKTILWWWWSGLQWQQRESQKSGRGTFVSDLQSFYSHCLLPLSSHYWDSEVNTVMGSTQLSEVVLRHSPVSDTLQPHWLCLPGSSVHVILQARILEWVAIPFLKESSHPMDWTWVSCIAGGFFIVWAIRIALSDVTRAQTFWKQEKNENPRDMEDTTEKWRGRN